MRLRSRHLFCLTTLLPLLATAADTLTVAMSDSWGMPLAGYQHTPQGMVIDRGIMHDWYAALGKVLGRDIRLTVVPPQRVSLMTRQAQIDLRCFGSPQWDANIIKQQFQWSPHVLLSVEERLVSTPGKPLVTDISQLQKLRIGTVSGYRYPLLEPLFEVGTLIRDNAPGEHQLLEKQLVGRTDYSVIRLMTLHYLQKQNTRWQALRPSPLRISQTDLYCAVHKRASLTLDALNQAMQTLEKQQVMATILRRHTGR
ncbi:ABC transporter substrate-binding protein [Chitinimonas sp. BJYL2]|uniref:substrate-binding periplasmic protein n=1 Tax=Chitinimonas sp. BJYL2 TaxID=2976696 RepID=UPI0022B3822F|nr:transporter substrate-binding domain-containing protein [Chitinimonas sp. BJYL2]